MSSQPVPPFSVPRRWQRFSINVPVRVVAEKEDKVLIVQGRGNELNEGGLAIFAGVELRENERVAVEFTPPYSGVPIRVHCEVRNRNGYNYGVQFRQESIADEEAVNQIKMVLRSMAS